LLQLEERKFWIPVYRGLFQHYARIGPAIWLFLWYIDKTTREECASGDRVGYVLGGAPVKDLAAAYDLACDRATVTRWRRLLESQGYVRIRRVWGGHVIYVMKSKRWLKSTDENAHLACKDARERCNSEHVTCKNAPPNKKIQGRHNKDSEIYSATRKLAEDGYSPVDGLNWKNWADKKRLPEEIEKLLAAGPGRGTRH
jgi:hypothetical protein